MRKFLYMTTLIVKLSMIIIAVWAIVPIITDNITIDSIVARLGLVSACIANLFHKKKKIKILLFLVSIILIVIATIMKIYFVQ